MQLLVIEVPPGFKPISQIKVDLKVKLTRFLLKNISIKLTCLKVATTNIIIIATNQMTAGKRCDNVKEVTVFIPFIHGTVSRRGLVKKIFCANIRHLHSLPLSSGTSFAVQTQPIIWAPAITFLSKCHHSLPDNVHKHHSIPPYLLAQATSFYIPLQPSSTSYFTASSSQPCLLLSSLFLPGSDTKLALLHLQFQNYALIYPNVSNILSSPPDWEGI